MNKKIIAITIFILVFAAGAYAVNASTSTDENVTINGYLTFTSGALNMTATSGALSLSGLLASSINTGVNALTITSAGWAVDTNGTLSILSNDGTLTIGQAFPNKSASTDNGIGMFNAPASAAFKSGLFTEVDGALLSYGINVTQIGDRNTTFVGGIFRMDTRAGNPYFSVKRQTGALSTENSDIQISSTNGYIGLGGWVSDSNTFPGTVSILSATATDIGLVVRGAAAQTANLNEWQNNAGTILTSITSAGALRIGTTGTPITNHYSATQANLVSASIASRTCGNYGTITVTGAVIGDTATVTPDHAVSVIEATNLSWSAYVSATNTVTIRACNPTLGAIDTANTQTWRADVWQH